jgi:hypothetical protein
MQDFGSGHDQFYSPRIPGRNVLDSDVVSYSIFVTDILRIIGNSRQNILAEKSFGSSKTANE